MGKIRKVPAQIKSKAFDRSLLTKDIDSQLQLWTHFIFPYTT